MSLVNMGKDFSTKKTKLSVIKFVKYWNRGYSWDCGNRRSNWGHISLEHDKKGCKWMGLAKKTLSNDRKVSLEKEGETTFRAQGLSDIWIAQIQEFLCFLFIEFIKLFKINILAC